MAKMSKLKRSQKAHLRLSLKAHKDGSPIGKIKDRYHMTVMNRQADFGRILTKSERKIIYKNCL